LWFSCIIFDLMKVIGLLILSATVLFFSCTKESFITSKDAQLSITSDTLKYDTVFVSAGSTYRSFKIINENNQKLRLSSVKLGGGSASSFKMNLDGITATQFTNVELNANDSVVVFMQVNVDPGTANLPFVIRDSVEIQYNGNKKLVQLEAWGQNAHFFRNRVISTNETWNNDLPYVILGGLGISTNVSLTINKGCRIYLHGDAPIIVDGTLLVNGLKDTVDRVCFRGDRLDEPYKDFPASWPGIFFRTASKDNVLKYAVIKNAYQAIAVQDSSINANPKLILNECVIDNAFDAGIIALNTSIRASNCLISNCGKNIFLAKGGNYQFTHCTVVSIGNSLIEHRSPVLTVANYSGSSINDLNALFRNCLFWGQNGLVDNEVEVLKNGNSVFNVNFDYNLWKVQTVPANITSNQIINNQLPLFDSINSSKKYYDFRLQTGSPAINKGVATPLLTDLNGKARVGFPDLGCFEKQ
jgi:hypothetical protein